jgi:hypothetical protein
MAVAPRTGLSKQFGLIEEVTWNTPLTVTRFYPVVDIEPDGGAEVIYSEAIIPDKIADEYGYVGRGNQSYSISTSGEMYDRSMGVLLKMMLGGVSTTGVGPYVHTFVQAEPQPSFTSQGAWADTTGTKRALTWGGCVVNSWEINIQAGKRVTWAMDYNAASETNATAVATVTLASSVVPIHAQHVLGTLMSGAVNIIGAKFSGKYEKTYDERRYIGSNIVGGRQLDQGMRKYQCELTLEFEDNFVQYLRHKNFTTGGTVATATVGSNLLVITFPTSHFISGPPKPTGRGLVQQTIVSEGLGWNSFEPITIVVTNSDATI